MPNVDLWISNVLASCNLPYDANMRRNLHADVLRSGNMFTKCYMPEFSDMRGEHHL